MGFRIGIDPQTSKRLIYVLFAVQACVVGGISYQHRHGNPLRMGVDEHGVMRFQSMREYLSDEVKYEELRLQDRPGDEAAMYDLQLKKVRLTAELDRLDALGHVAERDVPVAAGDLR